jgi:hypothetical protein
LGSDEKRHSDKGNNHQSGTGNDHLPNMISCEALEAISARRKKHTVTPDEAAELQAVIDEITAMNGEMSALYLATNVILRADMKPDR